ncbi:MAG: GntR family transcriptional regulator [Sphingomonadales bacterium]|nr:GntR family transcriptional regulator [Sphingomonadales bacterium]MDE2569713.1 GntR family transcriptional regulator [Sphingomonadales bacterium]
MSRSVDNAYLAIRDGIIKGIYPQGSHITAQQLAEANGLSRTPVREAMRRLSAEGLVSLIPNRGAFVSRWTRAEIDQTYELRVLLEAFAAQMAAERATEEQVGRLRELAVRMRDEVEGTTIDHEAIAAVNGEFHRAVLDSSGNARLRDIIGSLTEMPLVLVTFRNYSRAELQRSASQHLELVDAISVRDGNWAHAVMTAHIRSARHTLVRGTVD